jgi:uncharacterized protein (DUF1330 family)
MAKAYWITLYRAVRDADALMAYAKIAAPALTAAGGKVLVRGMPAHVFEGGLQERVVVIEFDSVEQATAAHESAEYQKALKLLGNAVDRDMRIVPGA